MVVADLDLLIAAHRVRAGTDEANGRLQALGVRRWALGGVQPSISAVECAEHPAEPTGGHDHVVVQEQDLFAPAGQDSLVAGGGEAAVVGVFDQPHLAGRTQEFGRAIGRPVIDHDQLVGLVGEEADAIQAHPGEGQLVVGHDDDGSELFVIGHLSLVVCPWSFVIGH